MGHARLGYSPGTFQIHSARDCPIPLRDQGQDTGMKTTLRWYLNRATMFLGTIAAGIVIIDSAKRW